MSAAKRIAEWIIVRTFTSVPLLLATHFQILYGHNPLTIKSKELAVTIADFLCEHTRKDHTNHRIERLYHAYYLIIYYFCAYELRELINRVKAVKPLPSTWQGCVCWEQNSSITKHTCYRELCDECKRTAFTFKHHRLSSTFLTTQSCLVTNMYIETDEPITDFKPMVIIDVRDENETDKYMLHKFRKVHLVSQTNGRYKYVLSPRICLYTAAMYAGAHIIIRREDPEDQWQFNHDYYIDGIYGVNNKLWHSMLLDDYYQNIPRNMLTYINGCVVRRYVRDN